MIRCSDTGCPSRTHEETPFFNVSVTMGEDRELCENPMKIPVKQFECMYCGSPGEEVVSRPTLGDLVARQ